MLYRRNSYKDGLRARILLSGKDEAEFNQLRARLLQEYDPQTTMEAELVEDIATTLLLKKRAGFFPEMCDFLEACREQLIRAAKQAVGWIRLCSSLPWRPSSFGAGEGRAG